MPNWKKVIFSGSNAVLSQITASTLPTGDGTENLIAYDATAGGFVQVGQGNLQSIIDGDWFINEADGYLSASKDINITGSLNVSGSTIVTSGSVQINNFQEGLEFFNGSNYTSNRIKLTSAQNLQFLAGSSFQFNPGVGSTSINASVQVCYQD